MSAPPADGKEPANAVHDAARLVETIEKEHRAAVVQTEYKVNPRTLTTVTGKVGEAHGGRLYGVDVTKLQCNDLLETLKKSHDVPTDKYSFPVTEAQEVGWYSKTYKRNVNSVAHNPRENTEITKYMDSFWAHEEQRKMAAAAGGAP